MMMYPGCEYVLSYYIRSARQMKGQVPGDCYGDAIFLLGRVIHWIDTAPEALTARKRKRT